MIPLRTRIIRSIAALIVLSGAVLAAFLVPSGEVAIIPREPITLDDRITIDGLPISPNGTIDMIGVSELPLSVGLRAVYTFNDRATIRPDTRTDTDRTLDEKRMVSSKDIAAALALQAAGRDVTFSGSGALVLQVESDGPAAGLLERDDRIMSVDGQRVFTAADVTEIVGRATPGQVIVLGIRRERLPRIVRVPAAPTTVAGRSARIGVNVVTQDLEVRLPNEVEIDSGEVIGPSAGLAFAIAVFDAADRADLLKGRHVVATGDLAVSGDVLRVGAVREKAIAAQEAGAEIFVVPSATAGRALEGVQVACDRALGPCLEILPVDTFQEAVDLLSLRSDQVGVHFAR